jgi:3-oxoacyl-ACP reductase-like protein
VAAEAAVAVAEAAAVAAAAAALAACGLQHSHLGRNPLGVHPLLVAISERFSISERSAFFEFRNVLYWTVEPVVWCSG